MELNGTDVVSIIHACAMSKVTSLKLGELEIKFTEEEKIEHRLAEPVVVYVDEKPEAKKDPVEETDFSDLEQMIEDPAGFLDAQASAHKEDEAHT